MAFSRIVRAFGKILFGASCCLLPQACLEAPSSPKISGGTLSVSVCARQRDTSCSAPFQISPADSFALFAKILPDSAAQKLSFRWVKGGEELCPAAIFATDSSRAPDSLLVEDSQGNRLSTPVAFLFDSAPVFQGILSPADGDTLSGDSTTSFHFAYAARDDDAGDSLFYTLEFDAEPFYAGTLTEVFTSGFSAGTHTFRVTVKDSFGLSDTSDAVTFFVRSGE